MIFTGVPTLAKLHSPRTPKQPLCTSKTPCQRERDRHLHGWLVSSGTHTQILAGCYRTSLAYSIFSTCKEEPCSQVLCRAPLMLKKTCHFSQTREGGRKSLWLMQQMEGQEIYVHILILPQASCVTLGKSLNLSLRLPSPTCKIRIKWFPLLMGLKSEIGLQMLPYSKGIVKCVDQSILTCVWSAKRTPSSSVHKCFPLSKLPYVSPHQSCINWY